MDSNQISLKRKPSSNPPQNTPVKFNAILTRHSAYSKNFRENKLNLTEVEGSAFNCTNKEPYLNL